MSLNATTILAGLLLLSTQALASGTHCSGFSVYYEDRTQDYGIPPPPGSLLEQVRIVVDGKEQASLTRHQDQANLGDFPYQIELKDKKVLSSEGGSAYGSEVFSATLQARSTADESLIEDQVVCKRSWAFVP